jgi:hypothetical protein
MILQSKWSSDRQSRARVVRVGRAEAILDASLQKP